MNTDIPKKTLANRITSWLDRRKAKAALRAEARAAKKLTDEAAKKKANEAKVAELFKQVDAAKKSFTEQGLLAVENVRYRKDATKAWFYLLTPSKEKIYEIEVLSTGATFLTVLEAPKAND